MGNVRVRREIGVFAVCAAMSFGCAAEPVGPESLDLDTLADALARDPVRACADDCMADYELGTDQRISCCSHCIVGIPYKKRGDNSAGIWVCTTETRLFELCIGQDVSGIKNFAADIEGCGPGFHEVTPPAWEAGTYCFRPGHAWNFACFDCDGDGDCQTSADDFASGNSLNECRDAVALCNTSGGTGDRSRYAKCSAIGRGTCCGPDSLTPGKDDAAVALDVNALLSEDTDYDCDCDDVAEDASTYEGDASF